MTCSYCGRDAATCQRIVGGCCGSCNYPTEARFFNRAGKSLRPLHGILSQVEGGQP